MLFTVQIYETFHDFPYSVTLVSLPTATKKQTHTHSRYVILIAFPLQQWLHERASILCYSTLRVLLQYIACVVTVHCVCCYSTLRVLFSNIVVSENNINL
jgi:hypothetical protein